MQVIVYRNLTRGCWSIAALKGARGRGPLIRHADEVALSGVSFIVSEAARQSVIRTKSRTVHAYCIGTLADAAPATTTRVNYSPYQGPDFVAAGAAITHADAVRFAADGKAYL